MVWFKSIVIGALLAALVAYFGMTGPDVAPLAVDALRSWVPPSAEDDRFDAALAAATQAEPAPEGSLEFRLRPNLPTWFAMSIPAAPPGDAVPLVLELTHPSVYAADLYLAMPGSDKPVARSGRRTPAADRLQARFPATLNLPPKANGHTVLVRLVATVPVRGTFALRARDEWAPLSLWQLRLMAACYSLVAVGAVFTLVQAVRLRSTPYALYFLVVMATGLAGMFLTGLGEDTLWSGLAQWRGQISAVLACSASGLVLLLGERAFALDVRSPRFSWVLRIFGLSGTLIGVAGLVLPLPAHQAVSHSAAALSIVLGLACVALAWRTANRPALWLLMGFTPVIIGVTFTTLGVATVLTFAPWMLLAMPLGSVLELPFNLYGLRLLERRRQRVRQSLQALAGEAEISSGSRAAVLARMASPMHRRATASLMLLRFEGLAPGSPNLLAVDAVEVERFIHTMMSAAVRPGNQVGRWSFHEIVVRNAHRQADAEIDDLSSALFAQALRCERFGLSPHAVHLRLAYAHIDSQIPPHSSWLTRLSAALDDPAHHRRRKLEWDLQTQQRVGSGSGSSSRTTG